MNGLVMAESNGKKNKVEWLPICCFSWNRDYLAMVI
jgi:hypothetical protein